MKLVSRSNAARLFLFSFITVIIITPLFQQGVFGDGIMYLTVAFNRFKGYGSFWEQRYSATSMTFFCEQPPLYFESLNVFYKLFGGAEVAEKIFTLVLLLAIVFFMTAIWNRLTQNKSKQLSLLPMFLLLLVPVFSWTFCNQVIETMVVPLSLLAFYLHLVFLRPANKTQQVLSFLGIVFLLFLLLLTKGAQSVFLLAALFLAGITNEKINLKKRLLENISLLLAFFGLCALVFLYNEKANFWLSSYYQKRLVATFNHVGATANYHAEIIVRYLSELIPLFGLSFLLSLWFKIKHKYSFGLQWQHIKKNKRAQWLLLISLSASLPMALTLEQRGFYLTPAFPFAAMAFALLYRRHFALLLSRVFAGRERIIAAVAVVMAAASLLFFFQFKNEYKRDEGMLKDVQTLKKIIPYGETIGIDRSMWNTFSLHSYLNKQNNNSLAISDTTLFFVQEKENHTPIPVGYKKLNLNTYWLDAYTK